MAYTPHASAVWLASLPASHIGDLLWDHGSPTATFYFGAATATLAALLFLALIVASRNGAPRS